MPENYRLGRQGSDDFDLTDKKTVITSVYQLPLQASRPGVRRFQARLAHCSPVPATGKFTRWPASEEINFTIKGDKVVAMKVETKPGGGIMGTLERLGVNVPMPPSGH